MFPYDANETNFFGGLINRIKLIDIVLDFKNRLFPGNPPFFQKITDVGNVFMRTMVVRLVDAGDVFCWHIFAFDLFVIRPALSVSDNTFHKQYG